MSIFFNEMMVWRRMSDTLAVRYSCVRNLHTNKYAVQSADHFYAPVNEVQISSMSAQFVELFLEESPETRCNWFDSVEEAIHDHDVQFND